MLYQKFAKDIDKPLKDPRSKVEISEQNIDTYTRYFNYKTILSAKL